MISNLTIDTRPDPDQDDLYTIVVSLRAQWRTDGDVSRYDGVVLDGVGVRHRGDAP